MRKVNTALFAKYFLCALVQEGSHQPHHFLGMNRVPIERPQFAFRANDRWAADSHVQIAAFQFDHSLEDFVDGKLSLLHGDSPQQETAQIVVGAISGLDAGAFSLVLNHWNVTPATFGYWTIESDAVGNDTLPSTLVL